MKCDMNQVFKISTKHVINEETMIRDYVYLQLLHMKQHGYIDIIKKNDIVYINPFGFNKASDYSTVGKFVVTDVEQREGQGALLTMSNGVRFVTISEAYAWRLEDIEKIIIKGWIFNHEEFMGLRNTIKENNVKLPLIDYIPAVDYTDENLFNAIEYANNISATCPKITDDIYFYSVGFREDKCICKIISIQPRAGMRNLYTVKHGEKEFKLDRVYLWTKQDIIDRLNVIK